MDVNEARWIVAEIERRWPSSSMPETTAQLWIEELQSLPILGATCALSLLFAEDDKRPSFARFRQVALDEQRDADRDHRQDRERELPLARRDEQVPAEIVGAWLRMLRAHLSKTHDGPLDDCLDCVPDRLIIERHAVSTFTVTCRECDDMGVVVVDEAGRRTSHPCPACNPTSYELWSQGHYEPNHSCSTCHPSARRKREAA